MPSYWECLATEQMQAIAAACRNRHVANLGAGNGKLSEFLLHC